MRANYTLNHPQAKRYISLSFAIVFVIATLISLIASPTKKSDALSGSQFNAGRIIDDSVFYHKGSMSASQIQSFLNSKVPVCDTNGTKPYGGTTRAAYGTSKGYPPPYICLKDYRTNTSNIAPESGLCNGYTGRSNETAAQIIYNVSQSCGISPKVILVMLQKEQGLITDDWPWPIQYQKAMGAFCPDTAPCDPGYSGFFKQVYYGAHRFKVYAANPDSFNYKAGRNNTILWHPNTACGSSTVYIQNQATANLYIYTPYRPNTAALNNLYGTGDACSSYGNRNFWRLFNDWFGTTLGSPFFRINHSEAIYILGANNNYYHVPNWNILYSYGYGKTSDRIISVSSAYVAGRVNSGMLPPVARFEGSAIYLVDDGKTHHFTSPDMFSRYGYSIGQEAKLPDWTKHYLPDSTEVQSIVKQSNGDPVYLIENGKKRHFIDRDAYDSGSPAYSTLPRVSIHGRYLSSYPNGAPVLTANKLLRRSDTNTYGFWDGSSLQDINTQTVNELGLSPDYTSVSGAINYLNRSSSKANKLVKSAGGQYYIFDSKIKFSVLSGDLTALGLTTADFTTTSDNLLNRVGTQAFYRAIRINNSHKVFLLQGKKRHHFASSQAVYENGLSMAGVKSIIGSTASLFPDSGKVILASGQLFRIGSSPQVFVVTGSNSRLYIPSRSIFDQYGYSMNNVLSLAESQVSNYVNEGQLSYFIKDASGNVWAVEGYGKKHPVSSTMQTSSNYNINVTNLESASLAFMSILDDGGSLTDLLQAPKDPRVYKIEGGQRRWITSRDAFDSNGFSWSNVLLVSKPFLESAPLGAPIN